MMEYPMVSVIIPVYNAGTYISRCVESVINQTYTRIQIILVDDGSTDNSGMLCDEYAEKDSRIVVIHQPNGGEMAARAAGVRRASGEWLYFVDSDDAILPDALESMVAFADKGYAAIIFETSDNAVMNAKEYAETLLRFHNWTVWGKLFRRDLFDENVITVPRYFKVGGDFLTQVRMLANYSDEDRIIIVPKQKYLYNTSNPNSVQLSHISNYEYESNVIREVDSGVERMSSSTQLAEPLFRWKLMYLGGMMGLKYDISYNDPWIVQLKSASQSYSLSSKERLILHAIDKPLLRCYFVLEKRMKCLGRRMLKKLSAR